ncbi:formate dehydrogenase subunit delta [Novosphingobium sp. CF614]|uniref:formate dehydrogenase subunit delta n=1 Tax=Novosphingobium sp. CF614 TaxID=1884364 RepID=UPI0015A5BF23|nr:formate dehydrogenase subunit delta [Novosphingobium sp. CF614]
MSNDQRLVHMAGQILRNFAAQGREEAIAATAEHLTLFWAPRMKARAIAMLEEPGAELPEEVRAAFAALRHPA